MQICIIGSGYVGLVAAACFAEQGNDVIAVDNNLQKLEQLRRGKVPIYEPGLSDLIQRNQKRGRLKFTESLADGVKLSKIIFIAVGTPQDEDGSADLTHVLAVARGIGEHMNTPKIVVNKSTVPVGTAVKVKEVITSLSKYRVDVVSNPEFLKEGAAIDDFMRPDRIVIGTDSEDAAEIMVELYAPFVRTNNPILVMDIASAELTKYAANAMLATRISFMNEMAILCELTGADIDKVRIGIGTDQRIGMSFLFPGIGYGGSCFPKDVQALIRSARDRGLTLQLASAVEAVNRVQKESLPKKVKSFYGEDLTGLTVAIWGLAFKPKTDDTREAPALTVCQELLKAGANLQCFDPEANASFKERIGERERLHYFEDNYEAASGADALVVCTEWNEFRNPNFSKLKELLKKPVIFDGRNLYHLADMEEFGFEYFSVGRKSIVEA
jgi:UDPglucose 6-dehydrogenase